MKTKRTLTRAAQAAKAIREELKKAFPYIKFEVRSDNYSMGDSVRIHYNDGVKSSRIEEITDKYQYGSFNGMDDIYEYTNSREDIPQSKYVSVTRSMSSEVKAQIVENIKLTFSGAENFTGNGYNENLGNEGQFVWRQFQEMEFIPEHTKEETRPEPVTVEAGKIQIIEYSPKAIAVIGDTKPIKEKLKELGGRFNFRLTCGAGWIFPKTKLEQVKTALSAKAEEPKETTLKEEINKTVDFFIETDKKIYGDVTPSTKEIMKIQGYEEVKEYSTLKDINEAANDEQIISLLNLSNLVNKRGGANV